VLWYSSQDATDPLSPSSPLSTTDVYYAEQIISLISFVFFGKIGNCVCIILNPFFAKIRLFSYSYALGNLLIFKYGVRRSDFTNPDYDKVINLFAKTVRKYPDSHTLINFLFRLKQQYHTRNDVQKIYEKFFDK